MSKRRTPTTKPSRPKGTPARGTAQMTTRKGRPSKNSRKAPIPAYVEDVLALLAKRSRRFSASRLLLRCIGVRNGGCKIKFAGLMKRCSRRALSRGSSCPPWPATRCAILRAETQLTDEFVATLGSRWL